MQGVSRLPSVRAPLGQVIHLESRPGAHCLYLMVETSGRRGREKKIIVKSTLKSCNCCRSVFFSGLQMHHKSSL